ncbi:hypothetical protein [Dielma fastidiosa]|uniref:hypothetical protein n=1 Tax=Dielma fastidiosa TaxID=1034346 RepID=UPI000D7A7585|nr:hypothetical protein [Dielma fastidiosa]MBS6169781.1 hypothetical protein [Bacillota bacterium]PWM54420.1 MAG: hypothetical protein DBX92_13435 [Dielma fastidiosa]
MKVMLPFDMRIHLGDRYYLDEEGKMRVSCWLASSNGRWYYLGSDGKMVKNQ